jgi:uncharacterized membrane protein
MTMRNNALLTKRDRVTVKPGKAALKPGKLLRILLLALLAPLVAYYLWTRGVLYFTFTREVYTDYFWFRAPWLLLHVICGITATLVGTLQMIPAIRARNRLLHRRLGRVYLGCIILSTLVSFYLVSTSALGLAYGVGLTMLGIVWLGSTLMGYVAIRNGNTDMHREWMIKSYVLTLSFVCFRSVEDLLAKNGIGDFIGRKVLMAWACWAIPFFITEVVLQARRLTKKNYQL